MCFSSARRNSTSTVAPKEKTVGNVELMPFSEEGFLNDLSQCAAVISGAGFTLVSEAVFLGKPLLAVPFGDHAEQILNGEYVRRLGFGETTPQLSRDVVLHFLRGLPHYRQNLARIHHDGNRELLATLDKALMEARGMIPAKPG